jgi:hypothetical protein
MSLQLGKNYGARFEDSMTLGVGRVHTRTRARTHTHTHTHTHTKMVVIICGYDCVT